ncbi:MAG: SDR family NAD(P)-dependent oxidoreductase [Candidatus Bathyarchaeum sp.]|nr:MAG: SDR family NAD(P)-dependent oxidoreductase [Candidatus Bathyarchaeum sp.]
MKALKGKAVVVTGGAGFIGSHLCRTLIDQGAKVTAFDNLSSGKIDFIEDLMDDGLKFVQGDIRDTTALEKATRNSEVIFHLAAQTSVPFSMEDAKEDCEVNVVGTLNVLEAAKKAGARLVFSSSCAVYGNPEKRPTPETYPTHPISFYGLSKFIGENYCGFYQENYGLEVVMLRIFNVYGPNGHGVLPDFLNKLRKTPDELEVLGTGRQGRDFVYVSDMVAILLLAATSPVAAGQIFNVGTGTTTSVRELANKIIEFLGLEGVEVSFTGGLAWEGDMDITQADNSKAVNILQWRPQVSLEEGLKKLISSGRY